MSQFLINSAEIQESLMESKYLVVKCALKIGNRLIDTQTLIDYGATGTPFVDKDFVLLHQLDEKELRESRELEVVDGRPIKSGTITTIAKFNMGI
jgi:hypothetical protein